MADPTVINCTTGTCTVAITIEPAPASSEHISDMTALWGLFLLAAVVIFCIRQLSKYFESTPHES